MWKLGVDVKTAQAARVIYALGSLPLVTSVESLGGYPEDSSFSRLTVIADLTEDQLDAWCYNTQSIAKFILGIWAIEEVSLCLE